MATLKAPRGTLQPPLFEPDTGWKAPSLQTVADALAANPRRVGYDTETRDPYLMELGPGHVGRTPGYMTGVSIAIEDGPSFYLPLRHEGGDNVEDPAKAVQMLASWAAAYEGTVVGMNMAYDIGWSATDGIEFKRARIRDVMIAEALIYELHESYSLASIAERRGLPGKEEAGLKEAARLYGVDARSGMWRLPARHVGPYAEQDAVLPLQIMRKQERDIEEQDLWQIFDLESDLQPVLCRMTRRGVRIDQKRLEHIERWTLRDELAELAEFSRLTGRKTTTEDIWSSEPLAKALACVGIKAGVTAKGADSVDKALLSRAEHPAAGHLLRARKFNKLRTTFCASVRSYMVNGRIHTHFNQVVRARDERGGGREGDVKGARYGRLSSDNPNLQQQPSRDEFAEEWRGIYLPEEDTEFCSCDYSQQEPRLTTHYADLMGLAGAHDAAEAYRNDPNTDNHQMMADLTGLPRKYAKNIYLGLTYGEGGAKLAHDLGLPTRWAVFPELYGDEVLYGETRMEALELKAANGGRVFEVAGAEAQRILDTFDARAPFLRKLAKKAERRAKAQGYIVTIMGRRCRFPLRPDGSFDWAHKALNRLIQGGSGDQTKKAMVEVDRAGYFLQLQVHDELNSSIRRRREGLEIAEIMRSVIKLRVPSKVDVEIGPSWGEAKLYTGEAA